MNPYFLVALVPLLASGCASTPPFDASASDTALADAAAIGPAAYASPIGAFTPRTPVNPAPWRAQNDAQAVKGAME
jgi:hypothetical protein